MQQYLIKRLLLSILTIALASIAVFGLMRILPGDVIMARLAEAGNVRSPEQLAAMRHQMGLDQGLVPSYLSWIGGVLQGDLGKSLWTGRPVSELIMSALPVTIQLGIMAIIIALIIGPVSGVISAIRQDTLLDYPVRVFAILGNAIPEFWLATLVILGLSIWFNYLPPTGIASIIHDPWKNLQQFIFPAFILGFRLSASTSRMTRSSMLEVLRQDYIRTARAKGLAETVVLYRHALKNALIPVVTIIGSQMGVIIGGAVILEAIFSLPGIGQVLYSSVVVRDYPMVQAVLLIFTVTIVVINLAVDILYARLDPRIQYR